MSTAENAAVAAPAEVEPIETTEARRGIRARAAAVASRASEKAGKWLGKGKEWAMSTVTRVALSALVASVVALMIGTGFGAIFTVAGLTKIAAATIVSGTINEAIVQKMVHVDGWGGFAIKTFMGLMIAAFTGAGIGAGVNALEHSGFFETASSRAHDFFASMITGTPDAGTHLTIHPGDHFNYAEKSFVIGDDGKWIEVPHNSSYPEIGSVDLVNAQFVPNPEAAQTSPSLEGATAGNPAAAQTAPVTAPEATVTHPVPYTAAPNDGVTQMMQHAAGAPSTAPHTGYEFYKWAVDNGIYGGTNGSPIIPTGAEGWYDKAGAFWIDLNPHDGVPPQMAVDAQGHATDWLKSLPRR